MNRILSKGKEAVEKAKVAVKEAVSSSDEAEDSGTGEKSGTGATSSAALPVAVAAAAASKVGSALESATDKLPSIAGKVASKVGDTVEERLAKVVQELEEFRDRVEQQLRQWWEERDELLQKLRDRFHIWLMSRLQTMLNVGLIKLGPTIKKGVTNSFMPNVIRGMIERAVDALWIEVSDMIVEAVTGMLRPDLMLVDSSPPDEGCCIGIRAFLRYNLYPFDKSVWQCMRNPVWVIFRILCLIPLVGVVQLLWFIVLIVIDRHDEWQLLQYILAFKGTQFITLGIIRTIFGSIKFYLCVTAVPPNCKEEWEFSGIAEAIAICFFIMQVVMTWIAFLHLPGSTQKGSYYRLLVQDLQKKGRISTKGDVEKGGLIGAGFLSEQAMRKEEMPALGHRMMKWLVYDMVVFLICVIIGLVAMFFHSQEKARVVGSDREGGLVSNWRFSATLYWIQALYGVCSAPFLLFLFPLVSTIFTHAKPTGYTRKGECVAFIGLTPEERAKALEEQRAARYKQDAEFQVEEKSGFESYLDKKLRLFQSKPSQGSAPPGQQQAPA